MSGKFKLGPISNSLLRKIQRFFYLITSWNSWCTYFGYRIAREYVDTYNDYNFSPKRNGEYKLLRILGEILEKPVVFDIGANVGDWSQKFLEFSPDANIYSFEPLGSTFEKLQKSVGEKAHVYCVALSDVQGTASFKKYEGHNSGINSLIVDSTFKDERGFELVEVKTEIGDIFSKENGIEKIDFMKVDVEGAEMKVFKGFENMFKAGAIDIVQFEYGYTSGDAGTLMNDFFNFFNQYGYKIGKIRRNGVEFIEFLEFDYLLNSFASGPNFIAINKSNTKLLNKFEKLLSV